MFSLAPIATASFFSMALKKALAKKIQWKAGIAYKNYGY
jgi:hypothetical protein